jgi:hypothetical protein
VDGLFQVVEPLLLKGDPPPGNNDNGSKPNGERLFGLISKGEVEEDRIRTIIIVSGEKDFLHPGERDF